MRFKSGRGGDTLNCAGWTKWKETFRNEKNDNVGLDFTIGV